jgi:predicted PurR-regulated permease PerM
VSTAKTSGEDTVRRLEDRIFLALVIAVTIAFAIVIAPFFGAILWAVIATIVFFPLRDRLTRAMPNHENRVALITLLVIIAAVILPALLLTVFLVQEALGLYSNIQAGKIDFHSYFRQFQHQIPPWGSQALERFGVTDFDAAMEKLATAIAGSFQTLASRAVNIGQYAFSFLLALGVMLYLSFFLLRDGNTLSARVFGAVPLQAEQRQALLDTFVTVIRATIKGSLVVAILQGIIGGLLFWALNINAPILWGVAMAVLAFLPVVGTGLIWLPVAIYMLATGLVVKGVILILGGVFVIGMVDNIVRPILVGRDTRIPDYMVLISTLGGLAVFGANGVVIGPVIAAMFVTLWTKFAASRAPAPTG